MKKFIYLFSITLVLSASSLTASASTGSTSNSNTGLIGGILDLLGLGGGSSNTTGSGSTPAGGGSTSSTQLPINSGVVYLMIAGMAIGIVALKKNVKAAELKG